MKNRFILFLAVLSLHATSQVYNAGTKYPEYKDIPDSMMNYVNHPFTNETYSLHLYGDAGYDIEFNARGSVSSGGSQAFIRVRSLNPDVTIRFGRWDSVWVPGNSNYNVTKVAKPLVYGEIINAPGAIWDSGPLYLTDHSGSSGGNKNVNDWVGGDFYLGLKYFVEDYMDGNTLQFGWIKIHCLDEDSCNVKEYSRSVDITGLTEKQRGTLSIYPNPVKNSFFIRNGAATVKNIRFNDILGKEINFTSRIAASDLEIVPPANIPAGCYFITYELGDRMVTSKIVKTE